MCLTYMMSIFLSLQFNFDGRGSSGNIGASQMVIEQNTLPHKYKKVRGVHDIVFVFRYRQTERRG